jgi:WD40 repeat protein
MASAQELRECSTFKGNRSYYRALLSPDGRLVASGGHDLMGAYLKMWEAATGREVGALPGWTISLNVLAFSPDGRRLAAAGSGTVRIWDVASRKPLGTLETDGDLVQALAFSQDGRRLAAAAALESRIWDVDSGKELASFRRLIRASTVQSLAFSKDLGTLAAPNYQEIELWDVTTGKVRKLLSEHRGSVCCAAYTSDSKALLAASSLYQGKTQTNRGEVRLWDVATGRASVVFSEGIGRVLDLALSPDGKVLAFLDVGELYAEADLKLVDVATGRQRVLHPEPGYSIVSLAFTAEGKLFVIGTSVDAVRLWEASGRDRASR